MKSKPRKSFSFEEKKEIERLLGRGFSQTMIANKLGRATSSISNEIRIRSIEGIYSAEKSEELAENIMKNRTKMRKKNALYQKLSLEERRFLESNLKKNYSAKHIAIKMNRPPSTILKEIQRNGGRYEYNAEKAQKRADINLGFVVEGMSEIQQKQEPILEKTDDLHERINNLEMQIEILFETIKGIKYGNT